MLKRKAACLDNELAFEELSISAIPPISQKHNTSKKLQVKKEPLKVRETGFWRWKWIITPPNMYVIHTRIGHDEPLTLGLGKSFHYNPYTDTYVVIPSAMQTIDIIVKCITKEKQGIKILAYLQWQISDFSIAYCKFDFSDQEPFRIINTQLSEQAKTTIIDQIATMNVEEVLTDKTPIIAALTKSLKTITNERESHAMGEDFGLKIITIQIKECNLSSEKLWRDLQAPFRLQQEKTARISQLSMQNEVLQKELESRYLKETTESEITTAIEHVKQSKETEILILKLAEESIRLSKEQENAQHKKTLQTELALHLINEESRLATMKMQVTRQAIKQEMMLKKQAFALKLLIQEQDDLLEMKALEARLKRQQQTHQTENELEDANKQLKIAWREKEINLVHMEQDIRNQINQPDLLRRLIDKSADIAAEMPDIQELKVLQTTQNDVTLSTFITKMLAVAESFGISLPDQISDEKDKTS